jgi:hypothetical protein
MGKINKINEANIMLSEKAMQEFKKLYLEEYGEEISDERATELGINLLTIFDKVYRPVKKEWVKELHEELKKIINQSKSNK